MHRQANEEATDLAAARRRFMAAVIDGDGDAVQRFTERMRCVRGFLGRLNRRYGRRLAADQLGDLAQDVWAEVWRRRREYRGHSSLETWVHGFCENALRNALRRRQRDPVGNARELDSACVVGDPAPANDARLTVGAALAALSSEERVVVELKHLAQMTFEEIAAELCISPNTAKTRNYRAIRTMARRLDTHAGATASLDARR